MRMSFEFGNQEIDPMFVGEAMAEACRELRNRFRLTANDCVLDIEFYDRDGCEQDFVDQDGDIVSYVFRPTPFEQTPDGMTFMAKWNKNPDVYMYLKKELDVY